MVLANQTATHGGYQGTTPTPIAFSMTEPDVMNASSKPSCFGPMVTNCITGFKPMLVHAGAPRNQMPQLQWPSSREQYEDKRKNLASKLALASVSAEAAKFTKVLEEAQEIATMGGADPADCWKEYCIQLVNHMGALDKIAEASEVYRAFFNYLSTSDLGMALINNEPWPIDKLYLRLARTITNVFDVGN